MITKKLIIILILLPGMALYAYQGGWPFVHHADATTAKAYTMRIKDLNANALSIIGVASLSTSRLSGSVAIVKIGNKTVKVLVKH